MSRLSAVVIALDEERNIRDCLEGLAFCDEIVLVDGGSRDRTAPVAAALGARVYPHPFEDFASQKNFGISKAAGDWVLLVDADERVSAELAAEVLEAVERPRADGYRFLRENRIFGRWMRHGGHGGDLQLRLVRRSLAVFEGKVHERVRLDGPLPVLERPLRHFSTPSVGEYMRKLNHYTSIEAELLRDRNTPPASGRMWVRPFAVLVRRLFVQRAFLDGPEGVLFAFLSAYYEFVRRAKHWESGDRRATGDHQGRSE